MQTPLFEPLQSGTPRLGPPQEVGAGLRIISSLDPKPEAPRAHQDQASIAVFMDFENIATTAESHYYTLDLQRLFAELGRRGRLVLKRAYADWSRFARYQDELLRHGVDLVQICPYGHKMARNRADVRMAIDAMEVLFTHPEVQAFAILSGDSDFSSLITRLQQYGKFVIGVGVREATSDLIPSLCDEFVYYDTLVAPEGGATQTPAPGPEARKVAEQYRRYLQDWGFIPLEASVRRMGLTRLFEAWQAGSAGLPLSRWLDRTDWKGLEAGSRQELGWLLLLSPALDFGPLPPSCVTPVQGLGTTSLEEFIEAAESGIIRFLGRANWPLEPEALACLLGLPVDKVESILRVWAGVLVSDNGAFHWAHREDPLQGAVFQPLRAELAKVSYPSGVTPSLGNARALFEEGMRYRRDQNFSMALQRFRQALRMTLDLWEAHTPGVGPYEIRWRAASYCSLRAGQLFNCRDYVGSLAYYRAFIALMIPGDPVWGKLGRLVNFMLHYGLAAFSKNAIPVATGPFVGRLLELFPDPTWGEQVRAWVKEVASLNPTMIAWLLNQLAGVEAPEGQKSDLEAFLWDHMWQAQPVC